MSLFGALNTAVSGLTAQSAAFGNISDNVANSQTTGYKAVDTSFIDYLTTSTATNNQPGAVSALPEYTNSVQGTVTQSSDPLAMAISGQGFFSVSEAAGTTVTGQPNFNPQTYYTQAGDFRLNNGSYLVNDAGQYLQGWTVNPQTGVTNQSQLAPIQITQTQFNPISTTNVDLSANLPATPATATPVSSQIEVYDALGSAHTLTLNWAQNSANDWTVRVSSPDNTPTSTVGTAEVQFGAASPNGVPAGTIGAFGTVTGGITGSAYAANQPASLTLTTNFGSGNQAINLNMGDFGEANGVTQFAGTQYTRVPSRRTAWHRAPSPVSRLPPRAMLSPTTTTDRPKPSHRCRLPPSPRPTRCSGRTARRSRSPPIPATRSRRPRTPTARAA